MKQRLSFIGVAVASAILASGASAQTSQQIAAAVAAQTAQNASPDFSTGSGSRPSITLPTITLTPPTSSIPVQAGTLSATTPAPTSSATSSSSSASPVQQDYITMADGTVAPVFGSQLFTGAFTAARPTRESSYIIQPGDQIAVRIFGAVNVDAVQTVDTSGELFVQGIGPVKVGGASVSSLQPTVSAALQKVYTNTVGVYVNVLQGGTLGVFLAGDVRRPGRYLGSPADNVLYFIDQAGGIDGSRGSFRTVSVRRNGRIVANFDFYNFITSGEIPPFAFKEGDVIFVSRRGTMVAVTGDAVNPYAFEAPSGASTILGSELLRLSRPSSTVTSAGITSVTSGLGQAKYFPIGEFERAQLANGDHVLLRSEVFTETISISVQGDLRGPSIFVLPRNALLSQLLAKVPLEGTDVEPTYVHIQRLSVAQAEKSALDKALDDLQRTILTTPTISTDAAASVSSQATQIAQYVAQAKQVVPTGKVAVYVDGKFNDLHLENGDIVIFPRRTDVVIVAGETLSPGAFAHSSGLTVVDYVNRAGGFTPNANHKQFVLQRADGTALVVAAKSHPRPGDEIVVVPQVVSRNFLLFKDLTTIIFQIATSAAAVINVIRN